MIKHLLNVANSKVREAAKRGSKIAQVLTGEGPRSPHWPTIEKRWKKSHSICAACGSAKHLQVHHIESFKLHPELELQDGTGIPPATGGAGSAPNFISLCMDRPECHLRIGHGGSFGGGGYNPNVLADAAAVHNGALPAPIWARAKASRVTE